MAPSSTLPAAAAPTGLRPSLQVRRPGSFYVNAKEGYSITYLTDTDPEPQGYGGGGGGGFSEPILLALDYKTGNVAWKHQYPSGGFGNAFPGVLTTAGKSSFSPAIPPANFLAFDPATGTHRLELPHRPDGEQRPVHLHAQRHAIRSGRRRRYPLRLQAGEG